MGSEVCRAEGSVWHAPAKGRGLWESPVGSGLGKHGTVGTRQGWGNRARREAVQNRKCFLPQKHVHLKKRPTIALLCKFSSLASDLQSLSRASWSLFWATCPENSPATYIRGNKSSQDTASAELELADIFSHAPVTLRSYIQEICIWLTPRRGTLCDKAWGLCAIRASVESFSGPGSRQRGYRYGS
jgi:hypothetical protein